MWKSVLSLFSIPGHAPQRLTIKRVKREYLQKKHLQDAVVADQDSPVFFISSYEPIIWRFFPLRQGGIGSGVPFCRF
ncbi:MULTISPECIES: hypothetical protein [Brucella]|uniref:Uncharacterized protein n=7 Tax=Brucella TaxID=234 RepID=Q2YQ46_BRUA2|nr:MULTISPECIES: hypothetical protein [Brucella]AAX74380.1 hypothetical protein BruAb1_1030 [Brucella abortus bv. 1 str. 9-941]ACU48008.1 hypothetical protein BMI_I1028 [Brucella microti CCM 4915]AEK54342.1 hypothetical protein BPI_I1066 [Brucella pinnipedialis B2/94]EEH14551.1 Hypothetical protein, conserved [Brucella ceti str. Cudo]EEP64496.1 Hypothetical protein, conserved [Brucella abortus str. 2308 A]EEX55241.1 predicted protein [Brucella abortus bv. 4 str. 292]EEX59059.1 predicted prot